LEGVEDFTGKLSADFFEETLHRIELWIGGGKFLEFNLNIDHQICFMSRGSIGNQHRLLSEIRSATLYPLQQRVTDQVWAET
jgi:hypothetical protein